MMVCGLLLASTDARAFLSRGPDKPELAFEVYFAGMPAVESNPEAGHLKSIFNHPDSRRIWSELSRRLAGDLRRILIHHGDEAAEELVSTLDVLVADLPRTELVAQSWHYSDRDTAWALALNLEGQDADGWDAAIRVLAELESGEPVREFDSSYASGWELRGVHDNRLFRLLRFKSWLLVSDNPGQDSVLGSLLENIMVFGHPYPGRNNGLVAGRSDLKVLIEQLEVPDLIRQGVPEWPTVEFEIKAESQRLRTEARVTFDKPMRVEAGPWHIPLQTIRDPLNSFIALQGIRPWLEEVDLLKRIQLGPLPNQAFLWSQMGQAPFVSSLAFPMNNVTNVLANSSARLIQYFNKPIRNRGLGELVWHENLTKLIWKGALPMMYPYAQPAIEPTGQFIESGLFPMSLSGSDSQPPPQELIDQVQARTDLLYYHWEITPLRIEQWRSIFQLTDLALLQFQKSPEGQLPFIRQYQRAYSWLDLAARFAGNTVTEVTMTSPTEFQLTRRSHLGLTALELIVTLRSLEAAGYLGETPAPVPTPARPSVSRPATKKVPARTAKKTAP